jgi:hypothetical protein
VDQPRYGPNGAAVRRAIEALRSLPAADLRRVAALAAAQPLPRGGPPWPAGLRPDEDDALRVSSELARRDAIQALAEPVSAEARRSLERAIHAIVLRHAFTEQATAALLGAWRGIVGGAADRPGVREDRRPRARRAADV